jgi:hypothetical protein
MKQVCAVGMSLPSHELGRLSILDLQSRANMSRNGDEGTIQNLSDHCERVLDLKNAKLNEEYFYQSLPLCVLDAVFSIGVRYEGTRHTVIRYCDYFKVARIRDDKTTIPTQSDQESISTFLARVEGIGIQRFTDEVLMNRQRTSSRSGILKSEASFLFARALKSNGVDYLQDVPPLISNDAFERKIKAIPGQGSGISLRYFFMLAGSDLFIKPDRHIKDFIKDGIGVAPNLDQSQSLLYKVAMKLKSKHTHLTPRLLDNLIWNFQRVIKKSSTKSQGVQPTDDSGLAPLSAKTTKATLGKHKDHIELKHSFQMAWDYLSESGNISLATAAGTAFEAGASIARDDRAAIRFFQKGTEYARVYGCCWGFYWNCHGTRAGMYCTALDSYLREHRIS